jgi:hypothetical protein
VTLPQPSQSTRGGVVLRIPEQGGLASPEADLPRGLLMLRVSASNAPDENVWLLEDPFGAGSASEPPKQAPREVVIRSLVLGVLLVLLFLFLLKLSGWL